MIETIINYILVEALFTSTFRQKMTDDNSYLEKMKSFGYSLPVETDEN